MVYAALSLENKDSTNYYLNFYLNKDTTDKSVVGLFSLKENEDNRYMQILFAGEKGRTFYTGEGPKSGTADTPYRYMTTPTLVCRQQGAWKRPFVAVYEPFRGSNHFSVESIENMDHSHPGQFTALKVSNKGGSKQIVLQSLDSGKLERNKDWSFLGNFGIISLEKNKLKYLYLGAGRQLSWQQYSIESGSSDGAANVIFNDKSLIVSCNQETTISITGSIAKSVTMETDGKKTQLAFSKTGKGISFKVPAVMNAVIAIE
ncbi:MAG: hypothetical protein EPN39_18820 [Chitinophagaceae bacterium]|nr:MAG: hypothetical protein EPN39_18820 [Chitinophagaceae bacterium]